MDGWIGLSGCRKWMESEKWIVESGKWIVESGAVPDLTQDQERKQGIQLPVLAHI